MLAAQAQDQVKYGIVRDPKVVAKMEAAAETQYPTPSIHLFRRLDQHNITMPAEVCMCATTLSQLQRWLFTCVHDAAGIAADDQSTTTTRVGSDCVISRASQRDALPNRGYGNVHNVRIQC